jgi:predicted aspartyl protease
MTALAVNVAARSQDIAPARAAGPLSEIVVEAPEPRFVAPTRRDKIGRIWAPVMINGQGPFRLVLDTGASRSGITAEVADRLGIPPDASRSVLLRGVTGSVTVPTIRVDSFAVGDVILTPATLPIVTDALGGAEGVLGTEGFADKRLYIDFKHDLITIAHSRGERVSADFVVIPLERSFTGLLVIHTQVAGVRVQAIIDTGGQATIGNEAMRAELVRRHAQGTSTPVTDVTTTTQAGESFPSPPIELGSIQIRGARITYGDMHIFEYWHLTKEPALLIGMDVIGLLDVFVIDYRRHELQLRTRADQN